MILDTDVLIDLLRERPEAESWLASLAVRPSLSGVAALESLFGARNAAELGSVRAFIDRFQIHWPTDEDSALASTFAAHKLSDGIDVLDAVSAATAIRLKLTLVTFNVKHFRAIPALSTLQPFKRV
jgi:predicted nucleic acid-binding protein